MAKFICIHLLFRSKKEFRLIIPVFNKMSCDKLDIMLLIRRMGLVGITNFLVALNAIILIPLLTKSLPVSDYGVWVQVNTTFLLITSITTLGLPYTMLRFLSAEKGDCKVMGC